MSPIPPAAAMTTDEIAAAIRQLMQANPLTTMLTQRPAAEFSQLITERLPYIDPADIAAVLIHTSSYLAASIDTYALWGLPADVGARTALNVVSVAGEQMHTQHSIKPPLT